MTTSQIKISTALTTLKTAETEKPSVRTCPHTRWGFAALRVALMSAGETAKFSAWAASDDGDRMLSDDDRAKVDGRIDALCVAVDNAVTAIKSYEGPGGSTRLPDDFGEDAIENGGWYDDRQFYNFGDAVKKAINEACEAYNDSCEDGEGGPVHPAQLALNLVEHTVASAGEAVTLAQGGEDYDLTDESAVAAQNALNKLADVVEALVGFTG